MEYKDKILSWLSKLEITTKKVLDLPNDTKLPNDWGKRELAIHLFSWDSELVEFADKLRKGGTFDWNEVHPEDMDINETNKGHMIDNEDLSFTEAVEVFADTRMELISTYEDLVNNYYQDEKSFTDYFTMWMHDVHHLKQAGIDTKELEE